MFYAILAVLLVIADQLSKYLIRANAEQLPVTLIPGVLDLTYVENTGAAWSILENHTWLLTLISAILVVVIAWLVVKKFFKGWIGITAATLILAGGVGNLIDRAIFGYVTDMIKTTFMNFPVFNVADCCITVGVVLLAIYVLFFYDKEEKKEAANHDDCDLPADGN